MLHVDFSILAQRSNDKCSCAMRNSSKTMYQPRQLLTCRLEPHKGNHHHRSQSKCELWCLQRYQYTHQTHILSERTYVFSSSAFLHNALSTITRAIVVEVVAILAIANTRAAASVVIVPAATTATAARVTVQSRTWGAAGLAVGEVTAVNPRVVRGWVQPAVVRR